MKAWRQAAVAVLATAAALSVPAPALARHHGGGQQALSQDEIYALTCGHLGVPCAIGRPHAHKARRGRHRRAVTARR